MCDGLREKDLFVKAPEGEESLSLDIYFEDDHFDL